MKTHSLVTGLALSLPAALVPATSMAEVSANIGLVSEYVFRGVFQEESSAFAGIDYVHDSGFYLGAWGADVGIGNEIDYYFGYSGGEDFTYKIGYTLYTYTSDSFPTDFFDDTYGEINLGIGYGIFALDHAIGEWDGAPLGRSLDYTFTSITITPEKGPYFKLGMWGDDYEDQWQFPNLKTPAGGDGDYLEIGYVYTMEEPAVDLSVAWIHSSDLVVTEGSTGDFALVFGIKKTIGIGE
jgi:hypothetical protein